MKRMAVAVAFLCVMPSLSRAQNPEVKFIADTLVVQAEGMYETDPDLATLTFDISSRDKDLKKAYEIATQSMQRIAALAERGRLKREDVSAGTLTLAPSYERDRKNKPKSYLVQGQIVLKVKNFSQIGSILDDAVQEGIVEFRSLTYSLQDEEAAKERAVAQAMRRAVGRASTALAENGQKAGAVRYAILDVRHLVGVAHLEAGASQVLVAADISSLPSNAPRAPSYPAVRPEKITVTATVQCAFQIK